MKKEIIKRGEKMQTLSYTGFNDIALGRDGEWISPASSWKIDNVRNVRCVWTSEGYKPTRNHPEWLDAFLDEDGAVQV